jgi:hypothetical protein
MKRAAILAGLVILTMLAGCAVSDVLFSVFGDHYSGGGTTRADKEYHYNQQLEAAREYGSLVP